MAHSAQFNDISATAVWFSDDKLCVRLADGREIGTPLDWFPRLKKASEAQRKNWRFIGKGRGIHWAELDEDISVEGLLTF